MHFNNTNVYIYIYVCIIKMHRCANGHIRSYKTGSYRSAVVKQFRNQT